jgi:hypothetical protein
MRPMRKRVICMALHKKVALSVRVTGRLKIAQRFIAGLGSALEWSPRSGTTEKGFKIDFQRAFCHRALGRRATPASKREYSEFFSSRLSLIFAAARVHKGRRRLCDREDLPILEREL